MVVRIPPFGSMCIYIYIYFLLFGTEEDVGRFTSDLYYSLYVLILNYAFNRLVIY